MDTITRDIGQPGLRASTPLYPPMSQRVPYVDGTVMTQALLDKAWSLCLTTDGLGNTDFINSLPTRAGGLYAIGNSLWMAWNTSYATGSWAYVNASQPSWLMGLSGDSIVFQRAPPGSNAFATMFTVYNSGGYLPLSGGTLTGPLTLAADPTVPLGAATKEYVDARVRWVPFTGPPQSFSAWDMTLDGDWTMVANKATSARPAPQPSGAETDLLPDWTPAQQSARATYTVYNEWTTNQGGWLNQYGVDVLAQNLGANHAVTLTINGTVKDTFTAIPDVAETYLHDITPVLMASGAIIRVTLKVTQVSNNQMYWVQQVGLFGSAPTYCSGAVGSKDGATGGTTAYGCHATFIPGTASLDWDVVAYGGSAAGGGGGAGVPEAPTDGQVYGRQGSTASWLAALPLTGGTVTGLLTASGGAALSGAVTAPTVATADSSTNVATTAFVHSVATGGGGVTSLAATAPITVSGATGAVTVGHTAGTASQILMTVSGTAAWHTLVAGDISSIAVNSFNSRTGAVTLTQADVSGVAVGSFNSRTGAVVLTLGDVTGVGGAPLASPAFTGVPTGPTAAVNTNTTQLATTAFVIGQGYATTTQLGNYLPLTGGTLTGALGGTTYTFSGACVHNGTLGLNGTVNVANSINVNLGGGGAAIYGDSGGAAHVVSANVYLDSSGTNLRWNVGGAAIGADSGGAVYLNAGGSGSIRAQTAAGAAFMPYADNATLLGAGGNRWTAVYAVNGTINTSDLREKTDVRECDLGTEFIMGLRPVSYRWRNLPAGQGPEKHYGLIAQDVAGALRGRPFGGLYRPKDESDRYGLAYDEMIAPLIKMVQEQQKCISEQQGRINELENELREVVSRLVGLMGEDDAELS